MRIAAFRRSTTAAPLKLVAELLPVVGRDFLPPFNDGGPIEAVFARVGAEVKYHLPPFNDGGPIEAA